MQKTILHTILVSSFVLAATSLTLGQDVKGLISQAAALSETAQAEPELTQIIDLCNDAEKLTLAPAQIEYFHNLEAWARNKRGELHSAASLETDDPAEIRKHEAAALSDYSLAVQKNPKHWQALHNRGLSYAVLGETEKALADFDTALQLNPEFETALYNKAEMLYEVGKFTESLAAYQAVLKLNAKDVGAMTGQAHCYYRLEHYESAMISYGQAVKLAPENPLVLANRADAYSDLGYWGEAIQDYKQALTLEKELPRAQQGLAWILATCPDDNYRNPELALRFAKAAVAQSSQIDFRYYDTLAAAEAASGQFETAKQRVGEAIKAAPTSEKPFLKHRLALYESRQPYREPKR